MGYRNGQATPGDGGARGVAFGADDRRIACTGEDKSVKIWDAATGQLTLDLQTSHMNFCLAFSPDGHHLAVGGWSKSVTVFETRGDK